MISKERARAASFDPEAQQFRKGNSPGKIAELVRRFAQYRQTTRVFVTPAPILKQVRINALLDGKELLMPAQGLKEGFLLLRPYQVPFRDLGYAVTYKGLAQYGLKVGEEELRKMPAGLLFTEVAATDRSGGFVGDGKGLFDLTVAILAESGALVPESRTFGVVGEAARILAEEIELAAWDVRLNGLVTSEEVLAASEEPPLGRRLLWAELPAKRIKKITPLWKLSQR
ncbi:5-formyltetrahydrofolate cyclo-ligase [Thiovibrio sp. JS02]